MIIIDICLSDIPASGRKKSDKNGKTYAKVVVDERKETDKFGNTHTLYMSQTKEEREAKKDREYVGSGVEFKFNANNNPSNTTKKEDYTDDLPF